MYKTQWICDFYVCFMFCIKDGYSGPLWRVNLMSVFSVFSYWVETADR